jgi:hypothetical protein
VREFSPAREEEALVMQQITDIYGRENGWGCFAHHIWRLIKAESSFAAAGSWKEEVIMTITWTMGTGVRRLGLLSVTFRPLLFQLTR